MGFFMTTTVRQNYKKNFGDEYFQQFDNQCDVLIIAGDVGHPLLPHYKEFFDFINRKSISKYVKFLIFVVRISLFKGIVEKKFIKYSSEIFERIFRIFI